MMCDQTQPLLEAFADGELGWGTAWRVRRHLAGCSACASELAELRQLDARVRAWRDVSAPANLQGRLAATLASAPPVVTPSPRRPLVMRRAAVGIAGVAVTAAAFFWLTPGQPGRPTIAFADVENAMQQVQTLSWTTTSYFTDQYGNKTDQYGNKINLTGQVAYTWIRRRPAAMATLYQRDGRWDLVDKRGEFVRTPDGHYQKQESSDYTKKDVADKVEHDIRRMTQSPDVSPKSSGTLITGYTSGHAISSPFHATSAPVQEHPAELDGRVQMLFIRDTEMTIAAYPAPFNVVHIKQSMWADPVTHRITQIEIQNTGGVLGPNVRGFLFYNHFLYNQPPPPGVFDWSPPGVKVNGR